MQPQAGPALQAGRQLREVVAVEVEDDLQRLPAALDVVEDVGVCGGTRWGWVTLRPAGALPSLRWGNVRPSSRPLLQARGPPRSPHRRQRLTPLCLPSLKMLLGLAGPHSPEWHPGVSLFSPPQRGSPRRPCLPPPGGVLELPCLRVCGIKISWGRCNKGKKNIQLKLNGFHEPMSPLKIN